MKLIVLLLFLPSLAIAQTYKCTQGGKSVYSDRPCAPNAQKLDIGDSPADLERLREAARIRAEMQSNVGAGDSIRREATDRAAQRRAEGVRPASTQTPSKEDYCNGLLRTAKEAKDEAAKWRYHQGLIDDAKRRQKEAEDEHFSKCYGSVTR